MFSKVPRPWDFLPKPASTTPSTSAVPNPTAPVEPRAPSQGSAENPEIPAELGPLMPQLILTSPTLPRGFNAQNVIPV